MLHGLLAMNWQPQNSFWKSSYQNRCQFVSNSIMTCIRPRGASEDENCHWDFTGERLLQASSADYLINHSFGIRTVNPPQKLHAINYIFNLSNTRICLFSEISDSIAILSFESPIRGTVTKQMPPLSLPNHPSQKPEPSLSLAFSLSLPPILPPSLYPPFLSSLFLSFILHWWFRIGAISWR